LAIRGTVRQIRSDQGSNFIGAKNELSTRVKVDKVVSYLAYKQCDFLLNAPSASHTGGVWERQIRTIRSVMNSVLLLCPGRLDDSSLRTLFYEVMAIINSRPLTVCDINDPTFELTISCWLKTKDYQGTNGPLLSSLRPYRTTTVLYVGSRSRWEFEEQLQ